jgi:hypothetical protein
MDFKPGVEHAPSATGRPSKKIPTPYSRPRIEIGGSAKKEKKDWRWISANELNEGDIIAGEGLVEEIKTQFQQGVEWRMYLRTPRYPHGTIVDGFKKYYAFTVEKKTDK